MCYIIPPICDTRKIFIRIPQKIKQIYLFKQCIMLEPNTYFTFDFDNNKYQIIIILKILRKKLYIFTKQIKFILNSLKNKYWITSCLILESDINNISNEIIHFNDLNYYCMMNIKTNSIILNKNSLIPPNILNYLNNVQTIQKAKNYYK